MIRHFAAFAASVAVFSSMLLFSGCYGDRWTGNFSEALGADVLETENAILEISGGDEDSRNARIEELKKLANEEGSIYRINAGDELSIKIYGHEDLDTVTKVSPDGTIGMIFVGQVKISDKTIAEACDTIKEGLESYIRHPVVGITIIKVSSETVTIGGACMRPGLYDISDHTRIADVYAMAGGSAVRLFNGVHADAADLENSLMVRDGRILPVDFQLAVKGDVLNNIKVHKGDYIFIAQRMESSITICGDVQSPQRRLYEAGVGLIEILTMAGWLKETHWSHVILIRNGLTDPKMFKIDVDGILAGRCRNVKLRPNDIIYVPKDNLSEYNVFVRKLMPTAQLVNVIGSRITTYTE